MEDDLGPLDRPRQKLVANLVPALGVLDRFLRKVDGVDYRPRPRQLSPTDVSLHP